MTYENVLITGASSGIGAGLAIKFASSGSNVYAAARRLSLLEKLASNNELPGRIIPVHLDVGNCDAAIENVKRIDDECGGLDLVISNAAITKSRHSGKLDWEKDVFPVLQINIMGAIAVISAALPLMMKRGRGHITGVSSLAGFRGLPHNAAYSAGKAALSIFLESLRTDLVGSGITVTTVHPGFVKTAMTEKNKHPMPFLMESEDAVSVIFRGIMKKKAMIEFPFLMTMASKGLKFMPNCIYIPVASRVHK